MRQKSAWQIFRYVVAFLGCLIIITGVLVPSTSSPAALPSPRRWVTIQQWLCPRQVPNLTAAAITFRHAQRIGLPLTPVARLSRNATDAFYSHFPGHTMISTTINETRRTSLFLRTKKCGSMSIIFYLKELKKTFPGGKSSSTLALADHLPSSDCLIAVVRDPISHFFSGLGQMEVNFIRDLKTRRARFSRRDEPAHKDKDSSVPTYGNFESLPQLSVLRFLSLMEFLLRGTWAHVFVNVLDNAKLYGDIDTGSFSHLFPQAGYFVQLAQVNRTISYYIQMEDLPGPTIPNVLHDQCGFPPPGAVFPNTAHFPHKKVHGLNQLHKKIFALGSTGGGAFNYVVQALCLVHAMDYACLAEVLQPPEVCRKTFEEVLYQPE